MQRVTASLLIAASLLVVGCASTRPVQEGAVYRSGQLSPRQLEEVVSKQGIRTVVNLRGPQQGARWYENQQQVCQRLGVRQVDVNLGGSEPNPREVQVLLDTYRTAERPLLVHSWSSQGSVGLASGLYRAEMLGQSPDQSRQELAWWMSHRIPLKSLSAHDRMLVDWNPGANGAGGAIPEEALAYDGRESPSPPPGSLLPLPAPSGELFRSVSQYSPRVEPQDPSDGDVARVAWLGEPIGLR